jgi:hypothetical protein
VDIFRSWRLVPPDAFHKIQSVHWGKVPYCVFLPVGLAFVGSISLRWYHPTNSPVWAVWCALGCQGISHLLTAVLWGRWQAKLSKDSLGPGSPYLAKILSTHWIATLLMNAYAFILLVWTIESVTRAQSVSLFRGRRSKKSWRTWRSGSIGYRGVLFTTMAYSHLHPQIPLTVPLQGFGRVVSSALQQLIHILPINIAPRKSRFTTDSIRCVHRACPSSGFMSYKTSPTMSCGERMAGRWRYRPG